MEMEGFRGTLGLFEGGRVRRSNDISGVYSLPLPPLFQLFLSGYCRTFYPFSSVLLTLWPTITFEWKRVKRGSVCWINVA